MKRILAPLVIAALATPLAAQTIDVDQPIASVCMAGFGQVDLAQSFVPTANNCSGAGVFMTGTGSAETLTFSLYENGLPGQGGTLLAAGSGLISPGGWADLFWPAVTVMPGNTYYLDFSPTASMCYAGSTSNPYLSGQAFANAGYVGFPTNDFAFRTYTDGGLALSMSGTCPSVVFDFTGAAPYGAIAILSGRSAANFLVPNGICAGTTLGVSPPVLRAIVGTDASGSFNLSAGLPPVACGTLFVQAVEISSCGTSNVVPII